MKNLGLAYLHGKIIKSISRINILENETQFLQLDDSFILHTDKDLIIQILVNHEVLVYNINSEKEIIVLGEYDLPNCKITVEKFYEFQTTPIQLIYNYIQGKSYNFGTKFLDVSANYIFGFCYGFDEVILITEEEFSLMISNYTEASEILIHTSNILKD